MKAGSGGNGGTAPPRHRVPTQQPTQQPSPQQQQVAGQWNILRNSHGASKET